MAKNDAVLLDGIVSERTTTENLDLGEAFELFAFEQLLKSYDPSRQEIDAGWVDGKDDGGIDGFYSFVNGSLVVDPTKFPWPKKGASIEVWIISCKHQDSFKQDPLNALLPTIEELLDFEKGPSDFDGKYSSQLLRARENLVAAFRSTASGSPKLQFKFVYVSRGDIADLAVNIEGRGNQLKRLVSDYFSEADVQLDYVGATELIALHRKSRFVLELPYAEQLSTDSGAYVLLVPLNGYAKFVSDGQGHLRRYLFDSNVRDFLGANAVNQDIAQTLTDEDAPEFWWLNNGVTILATRAIPLGKTAVGNAIQLHDVQIVNGLQTTQSIHNRFVDSPDTTNAACVLIKIIVSEDLAVRDKIIRATNNQSSVELAALTATDKIQRDIEEILVRYDWYYERRRNYYKNIGKPVERFVAPLFLAVGVVALIRKAPHSAARLKSRFMRDPESYQSVFSDRLPILIWPKLATIMKFVDVAIAEILPRNKRENRLRAGWRGAVALACVAEILGSFDYSVQALLDLDEALLSRERAAHIFEMLYLGPVGTQQSRDHVAFQPGRIDIHAISFGRANSIAGTDVIGRWQMPSASVHVPTSPQRQPKAVRQTSPAAAQLPAMQTIDVEKVFSRLPAQPWPKGVQHTVAEDTGLPLSIVKRAIKQLIGTGRFENQYDGVVVNLNGIITALDRDRADPRHVIGEIFVRTLTNDTGNVG
ncbi:AIPR family protein [Burkholderia sp. L27(2015)]|uniref:AIPR family protein n=1 Tax=Burkholderia sp. L27(2015) TaxID=1641858 RepID=UPI00131DF350|nr:AIPR family protein [Burkholderia sp. L27(2015)]